MMKYFMFQVWPAEGANYNYSAVIVLHFVFYRMKLLAQKECWYKTNMTSYIYNTSTSQWQNHQWFPVFFFFGLAHPVEANDVSILLLHHSNEVLFFKLVVWTEGQWQKKNKKMTELVYWKLYTWLISNDVTRLCSLWPCLETNDVTRCGLAITSVA